MCLPSGKIYVNEVKESNCIMITDCDSYDDFLMECEWLFDNYNDDTVLIYTDIDRYYEISKKEFMLRKEFD